ncbi:regulator [Streptomyces sp. DSM 42041]|uniref:Regulator n=1 Tax=Streptomyces hazeniae TaxID=3075538 RepID=A0ABU2NZA1_9ACTN|nr:regulator [Streptomyces sp. DSM 42041]MDT0382303.1 regulator [Streptomyces sp. DSM 42041]
MTTILSRSRFEDTSIALSSPELVRLVTEIDDNGTVPQRGLASALPDLTPHQIRKATEQADLLGLLDRCEDGLALSTAGRELADLYDVAARWARRHDVPDRTCNFTSRIRHTFTHLTEQAAGDHFSRTASGHGLDRLYQELANWVGTHQPRDLAAPGSTAA